MHNQRFFSYLSLFTFMMVILVTANNYLLMFVGWEGVGVCSYLLVCFWFTRIAANQSSLSAFLTNRVGDCFLTIGMFAILWSFGNSINALNKFNVSGNRSSRPCSFNCSKKKSRSLVRNFSCSHRPTNPLNPYFVTGFSDAESSFSVSIAKSTKQGKGWRVMCRFDVNLHKKDLDLLNSIKDFFGVGKVYLNTNDSCIYTVQSIKDLAIIINHFNNYPLITQKLAPAAPAGGLGLLRRGFHFI